MATDQSGALYILSSGDPATLPATTVLGTPANPSSYVIKLTPAGDKISWLTVLGFNAGAMAVDPAGSVYVTSPSNLSQGLVAKLNPGWTAFAYQATLGDGLALDALAVDGTGHAYVAGTTFGGTLKTTPNAFQGSPPNQLSHAFAVKLNTAGSAFDYATYLAGSDQDSPSGIAIDASGAAFVTGYSLSADFPITPGAYRTIGNPQNGAGAFLTRIAPDASRLLYSTFTGGTNAGAVAADANGNAVVLSSEPDGRTLLLHFDPTGMSVTFARTLPVTPFALAMDATGNTYLTGFAKGANYPVTHSLGVCGSLVLSAFSASGEVLQSTYVAGVSSRESPAALALGNATVYVLGPADGNSGAPLLLTRLAAGAPAQTVPLACIGNAATFDSGSVAAGEIVSLFGEGLGPAAGAQPQVDLQSGFPTQLAGVQVTFDGTPAPLLYVQDGQINAIAPWSLAAGETTRICVRFSGVDTNCLTRAVAQAAPGIFTTDGSHAAAVNQDGSVNSATNPAQPGSVVSIFATGLGPISPLQIDGSIVVPPLPANVLPLNAGIFVGGGVFGLGPVPIDVQYAGPAPYEVAGVSQINVVASGAPMFLHVGPNFNDPLAASQTVVLYVLP